MYLLDTNVLSELRKQAGRRSDARVTAWSKTIPLDSLYLSVVTIHEVEYGELHAVQTRNWQDALIAATAFVHDLVLVTRNVGHFADSEVPLLNRWEARQSLG